MKYQNGLKCDNCKVTVSDPEKIKSWIVIPMKYHWTYCSQSCCDEHKDDRDLNEELYK
jgi:hypothetical protein